MPYTYTKFGVIELPIYNIEQDISVGQVDSTILNTLNGKGFDYLGTLRRLPRSQNITVEGIYIEDVSLIVDESNNTIVDDAGDTLVTGSTGETLKAQVDRLRSAIGTVDSLIRTDLESLDERTKTARLVHVKQQKSVDERGILSPLTAVFETSQPRWKSQTLTTQNETLVVGANSLTVTPGGEESIDDCVITVTATGSNVGSVQVALNNSNFTWTGTLAVGDDLVIDAGKLTIENNASDAYSGFTLDVAHTLEGWFRLLAESNEITVTVDVACDITFEFYDQWM